MAYHAAKSQVPHLDLSNSKTPIYLSATIPTATYERLISKAAMYPCFVLPLPRPEAAALEEQSIPDVTDLSTTPHEFYFMQWGMHGSPPTPSSDGLPPLFNQLQSYSSSSSSSSLSSQKRDSPNNPPCTTVLFTSLQEYKLRNDYATPHLILTHYTDFAQSHGLVLFRGELTPSPPPSNLPSSSKAGRRSTLLSPDNAQRLALLLQQFYLPPQENDQRGAARVKLLQWFHEEPEAFHWEDLVDSIIL